MKTMITTAQTHDQARADFLNQAGQKAPTKPLAAAVRRSGFEVFVQFAVIVPLVL